MIASGVWWSGEKGVSGLESGLLIWVLWSLSAGFWAVKAGRFDLVLRALGGVWSACGVLWGLVAVSWEGVEEYFSYGAGAGIFC